MMRMGRLFRTRALAYRGSWVHFLKAKTLLLFLRIHLTKGCLYFLKTLKNGAVKASQSPRITSVHLHGNRCQLLRGDYIPSRTASAFPDAIPFEK